MCIATVISRFPFLKLVGGLLMVSTGMFGYAQESTDRNSTDRNSIDEDLNIKATETIEVVGRMTNAEVTFEDIERIQANDLEDLFRHIPSISVGGSLGIAQKIYIRGLEDTLLNVSVDGAPQTGTLFHHIGRVNVEPELLKQVKVITGAGEATAGAGAIGGAVRFKTKDADDLLEDGKRFGGIVKLNSFSNDGNKGSISLYGKLTDKLSLIGSFVTVDRDNVEDGDGDTLFGTAAEQQLAFVKASVNVSDSQYLSLSLEARDEEGRFGARPNWPALEGDTLYPGTAERRTAVLNYGLSTGSLLDFEATLSLTKSEFEQDRFDRWGRYGADIETFSFDIRNTSIFGDHSVTYGVEYRSDEVESKYLDDVSVWGDWAWEATVGVFKEEGSVAGIYIQDHYQLSDPLLVSFGARYDMYDFEMITYSEEADSEAFNPNVGIEYAITPEWKVSLGYAEASRGKEISDAFTLEKRPGRISVQPGLDGEKVENIEAGLIYDAGQFYASIVGYTTEIDDVIFDQLGRGPFPQDGTFFENVGTFETEGFEIELKYYFPRVSLEFSYSNSTSELNGVPVEGYEHNGLGNARGDTFNLRTSYDVTDNIVLGWNVMLVEDMNNIDVLSRSLEIGWVSQLEEIDKEGYTVHDVYMEWRPKGYENFRVHVGVQNLFDETYRDHSSVGDYGHIPDYEGVRGVNEPGRDIRLSLTARF